MSLPAILVEIGSDEMIPGIFDSSTSIRSSSRLETSTSTILCVLDTLSYSMDRPSRTSKFCRILKEESKELCFSFSVAASLHSVRQTIYSLLSVLMLQDQGSDSSKSGCVLPCEKLLESTIGSSHF